MTLPLSVTALFWPSNVLMLTQILSGSESSFITCPGVGRILGIINQDPSISKSNRLHVDIFRISFIKLGFIL